MKRTLKRGLKAFEIVNREANRTGISYWVIPATSSISSYLPESQDQRVIARCCWTVYNGLLCAGIDLKLFEGRVKETDECASNVLH